MALNKTTVAKRMTEVPKDFTAKLIASESAGKRDLFEYKADKYGTVRVRAYLPEGVSAKAIKGHVIDFDAQGTLAESPDDNTRRNEIVARVVIMLDDDGKPAGYGNMTDDNHDTSILVVVNVPNWANVSTIKLAV